MSREDTELAAWMRAELPAAEIYTERQMLRHATVLRVEIPAQVAEVAITDTEMAARYPEALTDAAVAVVDEVRANVVQAAGIQALIDNAREEGMAIVTEHLTWLQEQIDTLTEEAKEMKAFDTAHANLIGRKAALVRARRKLDLKAKVAE